MNFVLLLLFSCVAFSQIIYPDGKLGKIQYSKAIHNALPSYRAELLRVKFKSDISGKSLVLMENEAYSVPKGTGCLELEARFFIKSSWKEYKTKKCNIQIEANHTTIEKISSVLIHWDNNFLETDFGNRLGVNIKDSQNIIFKIQELQAEKTHYLFYLFEQNYSANYSGVKIMSNKTKNKKITGFQDQFDLTPPDLRASLKINFIGDKVFSNSDNGKIHSNSTYNYIALTILRSKAVQRNAYHPTFINLENSDQVPATAKKKDVHGHWKRVTYDKKDRSFYFYPLDNEEESEYFNAIVVNNIMLPLINIIPGMEFQQDIQILNVGKIATLYDGFFQITQLGENPTQHSESEWLIPFATKYRGTNNTYSPQILNSKLIPTERSLFLPRGWKYKLEAFIKLDDEHVEFESDMILDYR